MDSVLAADLVLGFEKKEGTLVRHAHSVYEVLKFPNHSVMLE